MDLGLKGKRAIVTGGSRGIGRAILIALIEDGAEVATCARGEDGLNRLAADVGALGGKLHTQALDVRDAAAFEAWLSGAAEVLGGIDIVVSNVSTRVTATGEPMWRETFETDLLQHVRLAEQAVPYLLKGSQPSLVFISSIAGVLTQLPPGEEAYGTMKAALVNYAGQLSARYGRKGLRVNTVSPGPIFFEGGVWDQIRQHQPALFESAARLSVLERHGTAEEVARAVAFLASPAAAYITGANLRVDGGMVKTANF
jgi:NAD(P)-dependent dehydrogenase (short-subunit alcohol dehydrogenase family)